jgi:hypothetical protein
MGAHYVSCNAAAAEQRPGVAAGVSRDDVVRYIFTDVHKAKNAAGISTRQTREIETQQVQGGCVHVINVHRVLQIPPGAVAALARDA